MIEITRMLTQISSDDSIGPQATSFAVERDLRETFAATTDR
jgi:hypothetical protein